MHIGIGMGVGLGGGGKLPDPNLPLWYTRRTNNTAVYIVSNSVGAGVGADTPAVTGWTAKLMAALKTKYGDGGEFIGNWNDLIVVNETTRWTLGAGWGNNGNCLHYGVSNSTDAGAAVITMSGRYYDVYAYAGLSMSTFNVAFDGGANETVGEASGSFRHVKTTFDKSTAASRALSFTRGTGWAFINGIAARSGAGLFSINSSISGGQLGTPGSWVSVYFVAQLALIQPAVTIISFGINEFRANVNPATFQSNLDAWVTQIGSNSSVIITSQNPVNETHTYPQTDYNAACAAVAAARGCRYIDIYTLMGGSYAAAQSAGYMGADAIHPIQAGHDFYYQTIYDHLTAA